ncbi:MAG: hypothetical protein H0W61_05895 [Bacteroidetes bacterium]|nr:hypothetical protein [Bacteroidota bacterium]
MFRQFTVIFLVSLLVGSSCAISKRHYRAGYYLAFKKASHAKPFAENARPGVIQAQVKTEESTALTAVTEIINTGVKTPSKVTLMVFPKPKIKTVNICDTIFLKSKFKIIGKVVEVSKSEVRYSDCNGNTVVRVLNAAAIQKIVYGSNYTDYFNSGKKDETGSEKAKEKPEPVGVYGLMAVIVSLFAALLAIINISLIGLYISIGIFVLALILTLVSFFIIARNPERYPNSKMTKTALGFIIATFFLLLLLFYTGNRFI